jgi:acyl-CoA dehydrogenase
MEQEDIEFICDSLERMFQDADLEAIDRSGGDGDDAAQFWSALEESGYPLLAVAEAKGGLGASIADCLPIASLCGQNGVPGPLVDAMIARALCAQAGLSPSAMRIGLATRDQGRAYLSYGSQVEQALLVDQGQCRLLAISQDVLTPLELGEDGASLIDLGKVQVLEECDAPNWLTPDSYRAVGAAIRSAQMAGAMRRILDTTLSYTGEREQFGRPLAKFQAVQQLLSDMACETAAAAASVELASDAMRADPQLGPSVMADIAAAKVRCGSAAAIVAANAHQAHGALGFTWEYSLGRFTRRLWQWQDEFGAQRHWASVLGDYLLSDNEANLWEWVSA